MRTFLLLACLAALPTPTSAQEWSARGTVVSRDGDPIRDVRIEVSGSFQSAISGADGSFFIPRLSGDSAVLSARRLGYVAARFVVHRNGAPSRVAMDAAPLRLSGVVVPGDALVPTSQTVTRESMRNLPALGEPDILRVLPFLAAVSQPNDMMSAAHLAGAASDETSMSFDGHPVQSPLHFSGMFSGINVAALDRVDVYAIHAPVGGPTRLGGLIDMRPRPASTRSREAVVSVLSSGLTITQPEVIGGVSALASGRITYADRVLDALRAKSIKGDEASLPSYADALIRLEIPVGAGTTVAPLIMVTSDSRRAGTPSSPRTTLDEMLSGATVSHAAPGWTSRARLSTDLFSIGNDERIGTRKRIDVGQRLTSVGAGLSVPFRSVAFAAEASVDRRDHHLAWKGARFSPILGSGLPDSSNVSQRQTVLFTSISASAHPVRSLTTVAAARLYSTDNSLYGAPLLRMEWSGDRIAVIGSIDRRYQFDGVYAAPVEETIAQPVFLFDRPRRSDGGALTARLLDGRAASRVRSFEVSGFARKNLDRPVGRTDLRTGLATAEFTRTSGRTVGATMSGSMVAERASVQLAYTFQRAYTRDSTGEHPSDWDIPQTLAVFAGVPVGAGWDVTSAFQFHSGFPVTPIASEIYTPRLGEPVGLDPRLLYGETNAARLDGYHRLDLGLRRTWKRGRSEWSFSAQVINALGTKNGFGYDWSQYVDALSIGATPETKRPGLPILPSVGLTVKW